MSRESSSRILAERGEEIWGKETDLTSRADRVAGLPGSDDGLADRRHSRESAHLSFFSLADQSSVR